MERREKPSGVETARAELLRSLFPPELMQHAARRMEAALEAKTRDGRDDHAVQLRAADSVLDRVLPRETHGNSKQGGQPVVVVIQPAFAELMPKRVKGLTS